MDLASLSSEAKKGLSRLPTLGADMASGLILFVVQLIQATSFAALVFQGTIKDGFGRCLWAALFSIAVVSVITARRTTASPIGISTDTPGIAVSALLATSVAGFASSAGLNAEQAIELTLLALTVTALLAGICFYLLGALKLANTLRFIPFAVVSGFLGASGVLIAAGGVQLLYAGRSFGEILEALLSPDGVRFAVAIAFAMLLRTGGKVVKSPYLLPALLIGCSALINLATWSTGIRQGWYLTVDANITPWIPSAALWSERAHLAVLLQALPEIITLVVVALVSVIVKYATVELTRQQTLDLDRELHAHGIGNLIVAPFGGFLMVANIATTQLAYKIGARGQAFAIVGAFAIAAFLLTGANITSLVPAPILGGLLIYLGYGLVTDALRTPFEQKAWFELAVTVAILLTCLAKGYIVGVLIGLLASCMIFAINYARIAVVRRHLTGDDLMGSAARPPAVTQLLREQAGGIHAFWLSGYLFFGSSEKIFDAVRAIIEAPSQQPPRFVILDFSDVPGADASARSSIAKLKALAERSGTRLLYSGLPQNLKLSFEQAGVLTSGNAEQSFSGFNRALHWCEGEIIAGQKSAQPSAEESFSTWLSSEVGGEKAAEVLLKYMERREATAGEVIYRAGDPSDSIAFVAEGAIEIRLPGAARTGNADRRMTGSTIIGEMGFFRRQPRGASVVAETASVIYVLERDRMRDMEKEQPFLAIALNRYIIRELSGRLAHANHEAAMLR